MANSFPILGSFKLLESVTSLRGDLTESTFVISGGSLRPVNGKAPGQIVWCIARTSTSDQALIDNIKYACDIVNCSLIQQGGPCFYPTSLINHASVVMSLYYQKMGRHYWNYDFKNSGLTAATDPSYGDCKYECAD